MDLKKFGFYETDRLQGSANYFRWSFTVENIFKGLKVWDIIDGNTSMTKAIAAAISDVSDESTSSEVIIEASSSSVDKGKLTEEVARTLAEAKESLKISEAAERFEERKQLCLNVFSATVAASILPVVKSMRDDPAGLWKRLRTKFESAALQRKLDLRNELMNLTMDDDTSIEDFIKIIDHYIMQLGDVDERVPDRELIHVVLRALPDKWKPFKMTFGLLLASNPKITFADLEQWLTAEEQNHKRQSLQVVEESLVMQRRNTIHKTRAKEKGPAKNSGRPPSSNHTSKFPPCGYCHKKGHREEDCWFRQTESQIKTLSVSQLQNVQKHIKSLQGGKHVSNIADSGKTQGSSSSDEEEAAEEVNLVAMLSQLAVDKDWIVDSGASSHFTNDKSSLQKFTQKSSTSATVSTASGSKMPVSGKGCITVQGNKVSNVMYVPSMTKSLLSVGKLTDRGHNVIFTSKHCYVMDAHNPKRLYLRATRDSKNSLYKLDVAHPHSRAFTHSTSSFLLHPEVANMCQDSQVIELWHRRIGHVNFKKLHAMTSKSLVTGVPKLAYSPQVCEACIMGKQHKHVIPKASSTHSTRPLELIHTDVCGPLPIASLFKSRYLVTFTDDYSRFTWVYFIKRKSEVFTIFQQFKARVEKQLQLRIAKVRSDRGGEYLSNEFNSMLTNLGIERQLTVAGNPHQNGTAERKNRTLFDCSRSMAFAAQLPSYLWEELLRAANYILNRCTTKPLGDCTPFQKLYNRTPNLEHLKVIGCTAYVLLPKKKRSKLDHKSIKAILVGYDDESKAYRCYDPASRKLLIAKDVVFNEAKPGHKLLQSETSLEDEFLEFGSNEGTNQAPPANHEHNAKRAAEPPTDFSTPDAEAPQSPSRDENITVPEQLPVQQIDSPSPPRPQSKQVNSYKETTAATTRRTSTRLSSTPYHLKDYALVSEEVNLSNISDDISVPDALNDPRWKAAMQSEMDAHRKNNTWTLVPLPAGQKAISARWILRTKEDPQTTTPRFKARVVARGFEQREGIDYDETFAPVVKWSTIRLVVALAAAFGWPLFHMDVVTAFLNGKLKEIVYMMQPPGFEVKGSEHLVCLLHRSIYGLKQSPRTWYTEIDSHLRATGWTRSQGDPNLYIMRRHDFLAIILLFVDDLLITGSDTAEIEIIKQQLRKQYDMKDLGEVRKYLGLEFKKVCNGYLVHQTGYCQKLVTEHGMTNAKPAFTPLPEGLTLLNDTNTEAVNSTTYSRLVGELIFLTNSRPDIAYSVGIVSRFMANPQHSHLLAAKHILRYCKTTADYGILYRRNPKAKLEGFSSSWNILGFTDSDWAADKQTRRSTGGHFITLSGSPISWSSKRQNTVSLSSTEAEYKSLSDGAREAVFLSRMLKELQLVNVNQTNMNCTDSEVTTQLENAHIPGPQDIVLNCDNVSAIKMSRNPVFHARSKHIELYHHYVRERVLEGEILVNYIPTEDQTADILTKALGKTKFAYHRARLGVVSTQDTS